jgi:hypothetical protein
MMESECGEGHTTMHHFVQGKCQYCGAAEQQPSKPAKLTKAERELVRLRYQGRCAYCGDQLGQRWHADHFEPIRRKWWTKEGGMERPQHDKLDNLFPACPPCNIDKHAMSLDAWRRKLQDACGVLSRGHATYRHAVRFGLVAETGAVVVFHFERAEQES